MSISTSIFSVVEVAVGHGGGAGELLEPAVVLAARLGADERDLGVLAGEGVLRVGGRGRGREQGRPAARADRDRIIDASVLDGTETTAPAIPADKQRPRFDVRRSWKV